MFTLDLLLYHVCFVWRPKRFQTIAHKKRRNCFDMWYISLIKNKRTMPVTDRGSNSLSSSQVRTIYHKLSFSCLSYRRVENTWMTSPAESLNQLSQRGHLLDGYIQTSEWQPILACIPKYRHGQCWPAAESGNVYWLYNHGSCLLTNSSINAATASYW